MVDIDEIYTFLGIQANARSLFSVRLSKRAKRVIWKAGTLKGVELIIPEDYPTSLVTQSLMQRRVTILEQIKTIALEREELKPSNVNLRAISQSWKVVYSYESRISDVQVICNDSKLHLYLVKDEVLEASHLLKKWLRFKARAILTKQLAEIARELGTSYNRVSVRNQKTLWGSCSRTGNINLNQRLLFLSPEIMSYVLYHELTHLKVFDHSKKFWQELSKVYDEPKKAQKTLRVQSSTHIPFWATAE